MAAPLSPSSLRNAAKEALARFHGLLGRCSPSALAARHPLLILCYHRVLEPLALREAPFPGICIEASTFERQVAYLARHFDLLTLSEAAARLPISSDRNRPLAVLTFDDGYADNHRVAFPVLRRLGVPATVFLVADYVDMARPLWFDALAMAVIRAEEERRMDGLLKVLSHRESTQALKRPGPLRRRIHAAVTALKGVPEPERAEVVKAVLDHAGGLEQRDVERVRLLQWREVQEMAGAGIEFGSHTATHPILTGLRPDRLDQEVSGSKQTLEANLGRPVTAFCYPNGDHDEAVVEAVKRAGYTCAVTTREAPNRPDTSPWLLNRAYVGPRTGTGFRGQMSGAVFTAELLHLL